MKFTIKNRQPVRKVVAYRGKKSGNLFLPVAEGINRYYTIFEDGQSPAITSQGLDGGMSETVYESLYEGDTVEITL